jgi:hypothetical protein
MKQIQFSIDANLTASLTVPKTCPVTNANTIAIANFPSQIAVWMVIKKLVDTLLRRRWTQRYVALSHDRCLLIGFG